MSNGKTMVRGVICALLGGTLWGFSGTCTQFLVSTYGVPASYITLIRMAGAGALLAAVMMVRERGKLRMMLRDGQTVKGLVLFAIIGLALGQLAYASCMEFTNAGTATVLQCLGTVMLIVFMCAHDRKAPERVEVVAAIMAIGATFLIATQGNPLTLSLPLGGLVWGLVNAVSVAFLAGYPTKLLDRWGSMSVMGCGMLIGSVLMIPVAHPWDVQVAWDAMSIAAMAAIAVLGTFVSFTLFLQGVKDLGGVKASLLGVVEPVSATFFSWALMGSHFTVMDLTGFALMIAMVIVVTAPKPAPAQARFARIRKSAWGARNNSPVRTQNPAAAADLLALSSRSPR